jgi:hypothetical protein
MTTKTTKHLFEAATLVSESASEDGTWVVKLISEGKGSSGTYRRELLDNHFHAFDGVLSFKNHPQWFEGPETRDFTMLAGQVVGETWVDFDKQGKRAIFANYLPDPEHKDKLVRYREKLGLSIYIEGSGYEDEETGEFIVDWFNPEDPYASVDVVIAPGARGKLTEAMQTTYSRVTQESKPGAEASAQESHERKLRMEKEIQEALEKVNSTLASVAEALSGLVTEKQAKESQEAQVEADAKAVEEKVAAVTANLDAVEAAREDLLPSQVESLRAEAKKGIDIAPLIESYKTVAKEALEAAGAKVTESQSQGRTFGDRKVESAADLGKVLG